MQTVNTKIISVKPLENSKVKLQTVESDYSNAYIITKDELVYPTLSDEELCKRYEQVKPIVLHNKNYRLVKNYNVKMLKNRPYIWYVDTDLRQKIESSKIEEVGEFTCYHPCASTRIFCPEIADILAQFPEELLSKSNAFFLTDYETVKFNSKDELVCHKSTVKALSLRK